MNKKNALTERALDSSQVLVLQRGSKTALILCEKRACGTLLLEEAVAVAGVSSRVIHQWVEAGLMHFTETPEGHLLICLNSLMQQR